MDSTPPAPAARPVPSPSRAWSPWPLLFLALAGWQGWMTLSLFGYESPWDRLLDDEPILSGRHPLHLYHGYLGAWSFHHTGRFSCYDHVFQAGYPKTPVFDSGSRLAELLLAACGGTYRPAAYKIGLAAASMLVPWLLLLAARSAGLSAPSAVLATAAGLLVWWSEPGRKALEAGDLELLLAALAALAHTGLLLLFDRAPGFGVWLGLLLTGAFGWLAHPLLFPLLLPLLLIYYLSVGVRHARFGWHLALFASEAAALGVNLFWLSDWVSYWWLRSPLPRATGMLRHRTFQTIWDSPLWGGAANRDLAVLLLGSALIGVCVFNQSQRRAAARLLGLGAFSLGVLAILGIAWEPLGRVGTAGLLVPALWFAALPAAHAWVQSYRLLTHLMRGPWRAAAVATLLLAAAVVFWLDTVQGFGERCARADPLQIGLGPERKALVDTLLQHTGPEARILWEDRPATREASRWTTLLPLLTKREFIGGLDPDAGIEHIQAGLIDGMLEGRQGRHIAKVSDAVLKAYCQRYNVGWVVCWSPAAVARFRAWTAGAEEVATVADDGTGYLFRIRGHTPSLALKGQARLLHANAHHLTFADVVPDASGRVVLSLHYQAGMRVAPSRVQVERCEEDVRDPVPFVRLRMTGPVARLTLMWEDRP